MKFFKNKHGAVNVFLVLILVPVLVVSCLFVDVSRTRLAGEVISSAGDLTLNTMLTQFDPVLNDYYGLLASCQDMDSFMAEADKYFMACVTSQGVEASEARKYVDQLEGLLGGSDGAIVDLLQIEKNGDDGFKVTVAPNGTLTNPALVKKEIVEFMKYRGPVDMVSEILERFRSVSKDLENSAKDADLTEEKKKTYEVEGDLIEKAMEAYDKLQEYKDLNITEADIEQLKQTLIEVEEKYEERHKKMVMDLYNTQDIAFRAIELTTDYSYSESEIDKDQINNFIHNTAKAIMDFNSAADSLDNSYNVMPEYNGTVYDLQYLVACDDILKQSDAYSNFIHKANSLCKNMAQLDTAMGMLDDGEKGEIYILPNYADVNTYGSKSRQAHYDLLSAQFEDIQNYYFYNPNSAYRAITDTLGGIWDRCGGLTDVSETDQIIRDIYAQIEEFYTRYDKAIDLLGKAADALKDTKDKAESYRVSFNKWSDQANSYDSTLSEMDREYINDPENRKILEQVTPEKIDALIQRVNNVKSLLGSIKAAINGYQYNGTSIRDIDSYGTFRAKSGVVEDNISYVTSELNAYANDSFHFTSSEEINNIRITENNHPAIHQVNTPELYRWLEEYFKEYQKDKDANQDKASRDKAQKDKEDLEDKYKESETEYGNAASENEIKDQPNLPSAGGGGGSDKPSSHDLTDISNFITGLFSNFGSTVGQAMVNLRDDLYTLDYVMSMFSYDTFEYEGKYRLLGSGARMSDWPYNSVSEKWQSTNLRFTDNKTLTNKMINSENNFSYGNEVEYIIYGNHNLANKASAYGTIFAIRYVLNLPAEFGRYWTGTGSPDAIALGATAAGIQVASYGIIPAALVRTVVILGLTAAETARDLQYLQRGMPVKLVKGRDDLEILYPYVVQAEKKKVQTADALYYSDYLCLILFIKLSFGDEYGIYSRIADVIQVNMDQNISPPFLMSKANVYYEATASLKVKPLMLDLPIVKNEGYSAPQDGGWNTYTYKAYRGY